MKILQVTPTYPPAWAYGGITRAVYEITEELCNRGHNVEVWTSDAFDRYSRIKNVHTERRAKVRHFKNLSFTLTRMLNIHVTLGMFKSAKKELRGFDIVHLHGARIFQNLAIYPYAKKYGVPYLLQAHGSLPSIATKQKMKWIYDVFLGHRLLRDASMAIALSPVEAQQYICAGIPEEKIAIIPDGIDLLEYADLPPKGKFKERYGIEKEVKVLLYLGRINRFKGIDFLIDSFAYLTKNMRYEDVILVIAGPDDGYLNETRKLVKHHKIESSVLFTGSLFGVRKVEAYLDASIVASLDSLKEVVFLLVPLEAAACGTPVIVTKSNYIAALVEEGKFGLCIEYGNVLGLASIFAEMLSKEDSRRKMGLKGREFVSQKFSWNDTVSMIEKVYEDIVKGQSISS